MQPQELAAMIEPALAKFRRVRRECERSPAAQAARRATDNRSYIDRNGRPRGKDRAAEAIARNDPELAELRRIRDRIYRLRRQYFDTQNPKLIDRMRKLVQLALEA